MLRSISECDDEATTPEIRNVTGLSNSQVAYRRTKLEEHGLIETRTAEPDGARTPPKVHSLTESAHSHIDSGLFELYNAPVTGDVEQLSVQSNHLRDRVDDLDRTIERLGERLEEVTAELDDRVGDPDDIRSATGEEDVAGAIHSLQTDLADLRADVSELDERKRGKFFR